MLQATCSRRSQSTQTFNWHWPAPTDDWETWKKLPACIATSFSVFLSATKARKPRRSWRSWAPTPPLTIAERRAHADALYAGGRYTDAGDEYRALANDSQADPKARSALLVAAAACDFKTKRLSKEAVDALPDSPDESGARRMYLAVELARSNDDSGAQQSLVTQMEQRFPTSPWLAEALYTSGNMYLLRKDYPQAITYFSELATRFPTHHYAPSSHWKAAWLNYRLGNYSAAAVMFDQQIANYAGGKEIPAALYWRGKLYADQEHQPAMAAAYYQTVSRAFEHYYYAQMARVRLAELGAVAPADVAMLSNIHREEIPALTDDVPEDDEHVIKARLLANAGLNEYIPPRFRRPMAANSGAPSPKRISTLRMVRSFAPCAC